MASKWDAFMLGVGGFVATGVVALIVVVIYGMGWSDALMSSACR